VVAIVILDATEPSRPQESSAALAARKLKNQFVVALEKRVDIN
jgi:translation initiation factor IF-2